MTIRSIDIETLQPFKAVLDVLPIKRETYDAVLASIREHGYDESKPINVWRGLIVDGHTRTKAAKDAGVSFVPACEHDFADEDEAFDYAVRQQVARRNLTGGELFKLIEIRDKRKRNGRPEKTVSRDTVSDPKRTREEVAEVIGISPATVARAQLVIDHADEPTKEAVRSGSKSINQAYKETRQKQKAVAEDEKASTKKDRAPLPVVTESFKPYYSVEEWQKLSKKVRERIIIEAPQKSNAVFNETNDNVEWALRTWNPVTGCLHNCQYCYARDIANRFYEQKFEPVFLPSRLNAPFNTKYPSQAKIEQTIGHVNCFVCSMADLFGKWVPQDWIDAVFQKVSASPQWNYLFLTKFPQRLAQLDWPDNAWVGTSVDTQAKVEFAERYFSGVRAGVKWLSCEPLLERVTFKSLKMFDWVVIGAQSQSSQAPEFQPEWEWVEHLIKQARDAGCKVYVKPNLKSRPREYPGHDGYQVLPLTA